MPRPDLDLHPLDYYCLLRIELNADLSCSVLNCTLLLPVAASSSTAVKYMYEYVLIDAVSAADARKESNPSAAHDRCRSEMPGIEKSHIKNAGVREASTSSTAVPVDGSTGRSLGKVLHYGPLVPFLSAWGKLPSL